MEGVTAGIFNSWASQLVVLPGWIARPVTIVYLLCLVRDFPPARNVCVWWSVACGIIVRLDKFSKSAVIAIDSPTMKLNKRVKLQQYSWLRNKFENIIKAFT